MPRRSPPTDRVVQVLELLASRNGEPLTLTQVARQLRLSVATCQSLLHSLCATSYAVRSPTTRAYTLGPAVIRLGNSARALTPVVALSASLVDRLADRTGFGCCLVTCQGGALHVVHRSEPSGGFAVPALADGPFPFAAPFGAAAAACLDDDDVDAWIARGPTMGDPDQAARTRALIGAIRSEGACAWTFGLATKVALPQFDGLLRDLALGGPELDRLRDVAQLLEFTGSRGFAIGELAVGERADVSLLTAAIAIGTAVPVIELQLHVYRDDMPADELRALAGSVRAVVDDIAAQLTGTT